MPSSSSPPSSSSSPPSSSSSPPSSSSTIKVKFLVDRQKKRVVFAEAGSDFVDVLFSFLALPLGGIVHLLSDQSGLVSLDNLYKSVNRLDPKRMHTDACKEMLLHPRSAAAIQCEDLKITGIYERNPRIFYTCSRVDCLTKSTWYYTYTLNTLCRLCGKLMDEYWFWPKETSDEEGVFVNHAAEFMITDDLRVMPLSSKNGFSLLKELQIEDASILQEMTIEFGWKEALNLLRKSLVSKNALTEVCFPHSYVRAVSDYSLPIKEEIIDIEVEKMISIELILNKRQNNVLYAEVGADFVNLMFSFLTFPLSSVFKILWERPPICGSSNNLYSSIERMGLDIFRSETCRNMLLNPKLSTFHGFKNQILELEEISSKKLIESMGCPKCYLSNGYNKPSNCLHIIKEAEFIEQNPKSAKGVPDSGRAFVGGSRKYMVTDNVHVAPLSFITAIGDGTSFPISKLVRKQVFVDNGKALALLSAMLDSNTVLTDVFFPKSKRQRRS